MTTATIVSLAAELTNLALPGLGAAIILLGKLYDKYSEFKESAVCATLDARLRQFAEELAKIPDKHRQSGSLVAQLELLIKDFALTINEYDKLKGVKRLMRNEEFLVKIKNHNEQLDHIIRMIQVGLSPKLEALLDWRNQFEKDINEIMIAVKESAAAQKEIKLSLENLVKKGENLENIVMEIKRNLIPNPNQAHRPQPTDWFNQMIVEIAERDFLGGKVVETPPTWLIAADEVVLKEKIDDAGVTIIYVGEWGGVQVAVKKDKNELGKNPVFLKHFQIWRTLLHPNVAQLYGAGLDSRRVPFLVYEYVSRQSLDRSWGPLLQKDLWKILYHAALGLTYLHKNHIVHGNLSCSKLLVTEKGDVKLFGFRASYISENDRSNSRRSSTNRDFAAPECLGIGPDGLDSGAERSPRFVSDVYSLGLTIVEAFGKQNPFDGYPDSKMKDFKRKNDLPKPQDMDKDAWTLVKQMCVCDPSQRVTLSYVAGQLKRYAQSAF